MAASSTHIANRALQILGAGRILDITEDSLEANEMARAYEPVRDAELNRRRWRFSFARVSLPALVATPDSDYAYQYQLPGDFIRLVEGGDIRSTPDESDYRSANGAALYQVEGRRILTNLEAPLAIRYIKRVTDTTMFSPAFDEALAARMAWETCERITGDNAKQDRCEARYRIAIREARQAQALELASEPVGDDTWMTARAL